MTEVRPRPLEGVRVIDFTHWAVGPIAAKMAAQLGAEVIKVERPDSYEGMRRTPINRTSTPGVNMSGPYSNLNTDKKCITLNMRHPEGFELAKRLIAGADCVIENFSAGVFDSWGLGWEELRKLNPRLTYVSLSGFGHSGPSRDLRSYGPTAQAASGLTFTSGLPGMAPGGWGFSYMDVMGGFLGGLALLMGLYESRVTGVGRQVDHCIIESSVALLGTFLLDYQVNGRPTLRPDFPPGNRPSFAQSAPYDTYRCEGKDRAGQDQWCFIGCETDAQFRALCGVMGRPGLADDARFATAAARVANREALDAEVTAWTSCYAKHYVMYRCQAAGVIAGAVQDEEAKVDFDPQLAHRGLYLALRHAELGVARFENFPVKLSRTPGEVRAPGPLYGEHNEQVFGDILGLAPGEVDRMRAEGII